MPHATCTNCGQMFNQKPDQPWARKCLPCWRADKTKGVVMRGPTSGGSILVDRLETELAEAKAENQRLRADCQKLNSQLTQARAAARPDEPRLTAVEAYRAKVLEPETLKRLRMLCHPDKHGGSPMAHDITLVLNDLLVRANVRN